VAIGIQGKRWLWRALGVTSENDSELLGLDYRLFGTSRGKRMFSSLVLPCQNAMRRKRFMSDLVKKRGELFQAFLVR